MNTQEKSLHFSTDTLRQRIQKRIVRSIGLHTTYLGCKKYTLPTGLESSMMLYLYLDHIYGLDLKNQRALQQVVTPMQWGTPLPGDSIGILFNDIYINHTSIYDWSNNRISRTKSTIDDRKAVLTLLDKPADPKDDLCIETKEYFKALLNTNEGAYNGAGLQALTNLIGLAYIHENLQHVDVVNVVKELRTHTNVIHQWLDIFEMIHMQQESEEFVLL